jgi:hypothetical protein
MSTYIVANVSKMFAETDPRQVSGSQAELGSLAGKIAWANAMEISEDQPPAWLVSDAPEALAGIREWAGEFGAWDDEEIAAWSAQECFALFAQQIAHEMRMLGSDDCEDIADLAEVYDSTDWDSESEYPTGSYYLENADLTVQFYTGCLD